MNLTYAGLEVRRLTRNVSNVVFIILLPGLFFLVFGAASDFGDQPVGSGNVSMYIMISMAAYGAALATTSIGGSAAVEQLQGWGRQLGLTPMSNRGFVAVKALVAMLIAAMPIVLIFALGLLTGADGSAGTWGASLLLVWLGAAVFALFGLAVGLSFPTETAIGAASGGVVVMAFLGNVFTPLTGWLLTVAKFTPLYGYVALSRYPLTRGEGVQGAPDESWWIPALNVGVWTLIFAVLATLSVQRSRRRQ